MIDYTIYTIFFIYGFLLLFFFLLATKVSQNLKKEYRPIYFRVYSRCLSAFQIIYMTSPFLGLIGTIYGLLSAFKSIGGIKGSDSGFNIIVSQLGVALELTVAGISMALPALILWIFFKNNYALLETYRNND